MIINITVDEPGWSIIEPFVYDLLNALPEAHSTEVDWLKKGPGLFEAMTIPSQVNYVGKGFSLYELGYRFHGSALVITRYLRNAWLWERVRVRGGAYGAFCLFDRLSGVLTFISYRDPNLIDTLHAFDQAASFLNDIHLDEKELNKSIVGAIGDIDAYMLPDAKGYVSMLRYLTGDTEEGRQQMRDEILSTDTPYFRAFSKVLNQVKECGLVTILGNPGAIETATNERQGWLNVVKVI
jgi:Zn-dependent M16 (insulinase) family peptidase